METVIIKVLVVVVAVLFWLALVYIAERQARKKHAATSRAELAGQGENQPQLD